MTPLQKALAFNNYNVADLLINAGALQNIRNIQNIPSRWESEWLFFIFVFYLIILFIISSFHGDYNNLFLNYKIKIRNRGMTLFQSPLITSPFVNKTNVTIKVATPSADSISQFGTSSFILSVTKFLPRSTWCATLLANSWT